MKMQMQEQRLIFWTGIAGLLGALGWIVGDILIVGHVADRSAFPLLFQTYATQIDTDLAGRVVGVGSTHLIAGALFAVFTIPLYLVGGWHLWRGIRSVGQPWSVPAATLIFFGYALAPLAHAAFYFVGAVYNIIPATASSDHPKLLALAEEFRHVLMMVYVPAVACQLLGMLLFSLAIATGRSSYPRWFAITSNPLVLALLTMVAPNLVGGVVGDALASAGFNSAWLLIYLQSLLLLRATDGASHA